MRKDIHSELTEEARRKRLGQFFSGVPLAQLLAAISHVKRASSIIDPMTGNGDMLEASASRNGKSSAFVAGVEIDPIAFKAADSRLGKAAHLINGNCFDLRTLLQLPRLSYKLVITNPPYIRYQSFSKAHNGDISLPSADEIRASLLECIDRVPHLDDTDKALFRSLVKNYSGLSDIAVPAWILCAMLTEVGGTLAMVVPESWLSRDYARVIHYLLLRWFRISVIVEDSNAAWFPDALVKTTLLVAERIKRRDSAFTWTTEEFTRVHVPAIAATETSVIGNLFPGVKDPESQFARALETGGGFPAKLEGFSVETVSMRLKAQNLFNSVKKAKWLPLVEPLKDTASVSINDCEMPSALSTWLGQSSITFASPGELGISISQGLRTGANQFFYTAQTETSGKMVVLTPDPVFEIPAISAPKDYILPVLRKQSELPEGFSLQFATLQGRVWAFHRYALPEDIEMSGERTLKPMTDAVAALVRKAAQTEVSKNGEIKLIPNLSAVCTNIRANPARFWYMLPGFARRHQPDFLIPRVNNGSPKTFANSTEPVLVDANFSTLWLEKSCRIPATAVLAILNSSWCVTAMEAIGSVMGGGALKLEATQLRRLPVPRLPETILAQLASLGKALMVANPSQSTIDEIDRLIATSLFHRGAQTKTSALLNLKDTFFNKRTL